MFASTNATDHPNNWLGGWLCLWGSFTKFRQFNYPLPRHRTSSIINSGNALYKQINNKADPCVLEKEGTAKLQALDPLQHGAARNNLCKII